LPNTGLAVLSGAGFECRARFAEKAIDDPLHDEMVEDDGLLHSAGASSAAKDASEAMDAVSDTSECNVGIARGEGRRAVSW
jgi:hypothetical protein